MPRYPMPVAGGVTDIQGSTVGPADVVFQIEGAWTGSIFFEAQTEGSSIYVAFPVTPLAGGAAVSSLVAGETGIWRSTGSGASGLRVRARFAPGTGTPTIAAFSTDNR